MYFIIENLLILLKDANFFILVLKIKTKSHRRDGSAKN
jgi:hypothetical protein